MATKFNWFNQLMARRKGATMDKNALKQDLFRDEGEVLHAYQDNLGYWTIGIGRLIDERRGGGITHEEAMYLLGHDVDRVIEALEDQIAFWPELSGLQKRALCNMAFQMGVAGLMEFKTMLGALADGNGKRAREAALQSLWARQTPERAERVAKMLE